jgi:YegS/Rv2252/BmrU family lipid kinase
LRRVALIYNPESGQYFNRRATLVRDTLAVLRDAGVDAEALATTAPGSAAALVEQAVRRGCDTILACGGDGTVHEVMQTLVGSDLALGVIPQGTANALAMDLGVPLSPLKAVKSLLTATPERVPVGRLHYRGLDGEPQSRYFTVAAGVGADGHLISRLDAKLKRRFGYAFYAVEGLRILATHSFPYFEAAFDEAGNGEVRVERVSQIMAIRIRNFGGLVNHLAPGANLHKTNLRLIAFKTNNRFHFVRFLLAVILGRQKFTGRIELMDAVSVECRALPGSNEQIFLEADGELLGQLPVRMEMVADALTLLVPRK